MLEIEGLFCSYGKVTVVRDLSMRVGKGELVTLIGANGAGKTTTLKAISGLIPITAKHIIFDGEDITGASPQEILSRGIAHCPEGRRVFPYMTVQENLDMGCYLRKDQDGIDTDLERVFEGFPILKQTPPSDGRHIVGRRATNAGDWQSVNVASKAYLVR